MEPTLMFATLDTANVVALFAPAGCATTDATCASVPPYGVASERFDVLFGAIIRS